MNEWWLLAGIALLLMFALSVALYPLRKFRVAMFCAPVLIILVTLAYWQWGAWPEWVGYLQTAEKQQRIQTMMKSMQNPADLIAKLKTTLQKNPDSARGWYLLGRLYVSQNQWQQADEAFERAHKLKPEDEQITVNYAQNIWQLNNQQFDNKSRGLLIEVLHRNAAQPDALAMLAMDAYRRDDYQQAIEYWQHLLKLVDPKSEEAQAIRKAIAKTRAKIQNHH